jgi:hypothetical protein
VYTMLVFCFCCIFLFIKIHIELFISKKFSLVNQEIIHGAFLFARGALSLLA